MNKDLSYEVILKVSKAFERAQYYFSNKNRKKIELAGLEPTLWKDQGMNIFDLIKLLSNEGFAVHLTTNGSLLYERIDDFKKSGIVLIRVSLHSMNPEIYRLITKQNNLEKVKLGIQKAREKGINVKINRLLLKGYLDDLPEQIEFCKELGIPLKLYSLIPQCENDKNIPKYFVSEYEVMENFLRGNFNVEVINKEFRRTRMKYTSDQIGNIEFKMFSIDHTNHSYCVHCDMRTICREYFAEYLRFNNNYELQFCLCRPVYSLDMSKKITESEDKIVDFFKDELERVFKQKSLPYLSLRFIITENCNYKCGYPKGDNWCHSEGIMRIV